ncbi:MAG: hypothetical protein H0W64_12725 [Gammaproteobacteria bacterium]|nr:hypothetical protein [Gammaproteobacteria bacterium]
MKFFLVAGILSIVCGCESNVRPEAEEDPIITNFSVGRWNNKHKDNNDLIGVRIQQFPDCAGESKPYEGKHPAMIIYVMRDGTCNQVRYSPEGKITEDFWWKMDLANPYIEFYRISK